MDVGSLFDEKVQNCYVKVSIESSLSQLNLKACGELYECNHLTLCTKCMSVRKHISSLDFSSQLKWTSKKNNLSVRELHFKMSSVNESGLIKQLSWH